MPTRKKKSVEIELPHVLKRLDGTVQARLMLTPTDAQKINLSRIKKGIIGGRWEYDPQGTPWAELDNLGHTERPMQFPVMLLSMMCPEYYPAPEEKTSTKTRGIWRKPISE